MENLNYADLPQLAFQIDSGAPLTIFKHKPNQDLPTIVYKDYMEEGPIGQALAEIGVSWNYAVFSKVSSEVAIKTFGILHSLKDEPIVLTFFSGFIDMETGELTEFLENNILPNMVRTVAPLEYFGVGHEEDETALPHVIQLTKDKVVANNFACTGLTYSVPYYPGAELPTDPEEEEETLSLGKVLLLSNAEATSNLEAIIDQAKIKNPGNTFSYILNNGYFDFCLKSRKNIPRTTGKFKTDCAGYVGKFAIEINGEIVPYAFKAEDLSSFFDGSKKEYPIKFIDCNEIPVEIPCEPYVDIFLFNRNTTLEGSWSLQYSVNDGPRLTYHRLDFPSTSFADIFRDFLYESLSGYKIDGGGGGLAYFQLSGNRTSIYPGDGSAGGSPVKLTVYKSDEQDDIFDLLFIHEPTVTELSAMSCGLTNFMGY